MSKHRYFENMVKRSTATPDEKINFIKAYYDSLTEEIASLDILHLEELEPVYEDLKAARSKVAELEEEAKVTKAHNKHISSELSTAGSELESVKSAFNIGDKSEQDPN